MMNKFLLVVLVSFAACQTTDPSGPSEAQVSPSIQSDDNNSNSEIWSSVQVNTEKPELEEPDQNLFGKFYNERIEFHIIEEPDIYLHEARVDRITLYYIDGILCRKKYELDRAIADELAVKYGTVSYKSLNYSTDSIARNMGIVLLAGSGKRFNPYLKKYQLKWKLDDKFIYFQHLEELDKTHNYFIEEMAEYRNLYRSVQKDLL